MSLLLNLFLSVFLFFSLLFRRCILSLLSSSCHRHRFILQYNIKIGCPFLGHLLQLSDSDSYRSQFLNQSRHFHLCGNGLCSSGTRRHQGSLAFFNVAENGIECIRSHRFGAALGTVAHDRHVVTKAARAACRVWATGGAAPTARHGTSRPVFWTGRKTFAARHCLAVNT